MDELELWVPDDLHVTRGDVVVPIGTLNDEEIQQVAEAFYNFLYDYREAARLPQ